MVERPVLALKHEPGGVDRFVGGLQVSIDPSDDLYTTALVPLALTMIGGWLLLAPLLWFARDRDLSIAKLVRCGVNRPGA